MSSTEVVYIVDTTLHIHTLCPCTKDELNLILLATHLCIVSEVRLHTFQISHYHTSRREHVRITQSPWEPIASFLHYICRGTLIERGGEQERAVKITFDSFLRPIVDPWKAGLCTRTLVCNLPDSEAGLITKHYNLSHIH